MSKSNVLLLQEKTARCPECGHVSIKKLEKGFYCQNVKCSVELIIDANCVVTKVDHVG